jgi:hypothetical protein
MIRTINRKSGFDTKNVIGYKSINNQTYCITCLAKDGTIPFDEFQPITKAQAHKERLICEECHEEILDLKYKKFLERVDKARKYGKV